MKAAILCVGTELVDGQITNRNAAWISERLKQKGLQTLMHLVTPDERPLIREFLELAAAKTEVVFVTGGLGPTSDDFTREVIADWAERKLVFDDRSWNHINERLTSRGYTVKEIQRQQCYFPEGAKILFNSEGTANGFQMQVRGKEVFALPGPPREIAAIWNSDVANWLAQATQNIDPFITRKWDTLGVGESDVADITEKVLKDVPVEKGYRVHLPYVEVKLSYPKSKEKDFLPAVEKLTEALQFCLVARDSAEPPALLAEALDGIKSISFVDEVTGAFLMSRLQPALRKFMSEGRWNFSTGTHSENSEIQCSLVRVGENSCKVIFAAGGRQVVDHLTTPYKTQNMKERRQQYFAELAILFWLRHLKNY